MLGRRANFRAWKMATGDSVVDAPSLLPKNTTALLRIWDVLAGSLRGFIALVPYKQDYVTSGADGRLMAIGE